MLEDRLGFQQVRSKEQEDRALELRALLVEGSNEFNKAFIQSKGWKVAVIESSEHIAVEDISPLSKAMQSIGVFECFAIENEDIWEGPPSCFLVSATVDGIMAFDEECGPFIFLLVPDSLQFSILFTKSDYYLVAGPLEFIESAIGKSLAEVRDEFMAFANSMGGAQWDALHPEFGGFGEKEQKRLSAVLDRYMP